MQSAGSTNAAGLPAAWRSTVPSSANKKWRLKGNGSERGRSVQWCRHTDGTRPPSERVAWRSWRGYWTSKSASERQEEGKAHQTREPRCASAECEVTENVRHAGEASHAEGLSCRRSTKAWSSHTPSTSHIMQLNLSQGSQGALHPHASTTLWLETRPVVRGPAERNFACSPLRRDSAAGAPQTLSSVTDALTRASGDCLA